MSTSARQPSGSWDILDRLYADLQVLIASFERGSSAELVQRLRAVEQGVEQLKESIRQTPDIGGEERKQIAKIRSLYKQEDGTKNNGKIECSICGSLVLLQGAASWKQGPTVALPLARQRRDQAPGETQNEELSGWWTVTNMMNFESVGFTHSVEKVKYLTCADCEYGPIGLLDPDTGLHLVAPTRVKVHVS